MTEYWIHGLVIESELPLDAWRVAAGRPPERTLVRDSGKPDYRIIRGDLADPVRGLPPGRPLGASDEAGYWAAASSDAPTRWRIRYGDVCEVSLDGRRRTITVHPWPGVSDGLISIVVSGSVLAHALAMEGRLALHASTVEVNGRALAILGSSGAGKSTLAMSLCESGAPLIGDDTLCVELRGGELRCFPGGRGIRLRPGVAALAGGIPGAEIYMAADERTVVVASAPRDASLELVAAVVPSITREVDKVELESLGPRESLLELLRYPRLNHWRDPEAIRSLFELTAAIGTSLEVCRARIPWGPPFPPDVPVRLLALAGEAEGG